MKSKLFLICSLLLNSFLLLYGCLNYVRMAEIISYRETIKHVQAPTEAEWETLHNPKHFSFIKEHVSRLTKNVHDYGNALDGSIKKIRAQSMLYVICAILNAGLFVLIYSPRPRT